MTAQEIGTLVLLVILQLAALRLSQYRAPQTYFTTAQLVDDPTSVGSQPVAFRLLLPASAGVFASLLLGGNAPEIAAASGFVAWGLMIWPAIWAPRSVSVSRRKSFWLVVIAFFVGFAAVAYGTAVLADAFIALASDEGVDWANVLIESVPSILISAPMLLIQRSEVQEVQVGSSPDEEHASEEEDEDELDMDLDWRETLSVYAGEIASVVAITASVLSVVAVARTYGRSR